MELNGFARGVLKSLLLLGSSTLAISGAAHAQDRTVDFDVPSQAASASIPAFAREANVQILISATDAKGKKQIPFAAHFPSTRR